jgi:CheY-like chemotaxis protein
MFSSTKEGLRSRQRRRSEASGQSKAARTRALLVEDNTVNQKLAVRSLEKQHCVATVACNGLRAIEGLQKKSFDLILMNIQMPLMDGFQATLRIREKKNSLEIISHHCHDRARYEQRS